ncbi:hypothetical protein EMIHUDRAFT_197284 [Emiliania huxleyi CCMP1516]|uniref:RING-type domain-containing protein n=2 Tax=Emiliania huxleyi TaxID=2903 RepID=A0A0D3IU08_EMIH1|nr:hypothetical protein EMIHUDRAFT_197284 [Emiliania huxleyi CCMP1516]EOD14743.1 hypothetical protein EMIHUDRAFT_197284 [Emiliania huxleyi CCMP1516]|eukprot:XP_005767172.1 hypothetical protein EMIHUDRAFT_197284 [Emiliania huxleyi CCMP1516]
MAVGAQLAAHGRAAVVSQASTRADGSDTPDAVEDRCWICYEGPRDAVLLECGHGGICVACARRVFKKRGRLCPMCRQPVSQMVQLQLGDGHGSELEMPRGSIVPVRPAELPENWLNG